MPTATAKRIAQLTAASQHVVDPDVDVAGELDLSRPILHRELLSVAGLDLRLSDEQWRTLSREEVAAVTDGGIRFEALLMAGFGRRIAYAADVTDDQVIYVLHELGEETRHSRLFIRVLAQLQPSARNPMTRGPLAVLDRWITALVLRRPLLFCVMVLAGEELPDLFQKRAAAHPDTDNFFRAVNRYHRAEEARHLAYARGLLSELWANANLLDRLAVRWFAPLALRAVADSLVHPGVYRTVGLPGWRTWRAANRTAHRQAFRAAAFTPVLRALVDADAFGARGRVTRPWRRLISPSE